VLAVRDLDRGAALARELGPLSEARFLDCASVASVRRFADSWQGPIAGLINNAGVQIISGTRNSQDGYEETFAVNHLAALLLTLRLLRPLTGGRVLFIGSGTHVPGEPWARLFGFRGARFTSIAALSRGESEELEDQQMGRDRYATSKFLTTVTTIALARRIPADKTAFFCLDPGLMAGTGLARMQSPTRRWLWTNVLPVLARLLPGNSTPERSAEAARFLLCEAPRQASCQVFSFDKKPCKHVWSRAYDEDVGRAVLDDSCALLGEHPLSAMPPWRDTSWGSNLA
jgi:protochlorophyllide reductase